MLPQLWLDRLFLGRAGQGRAGQGRAGQEIKALIAAGRAAMQQLKECLRLARS